MTRLLLAALAAAALVVIAPQAAVACSCVQMSVAEQVDRADTVLAGTVEWSSTDQVSTRVYSLRVDTVYKGEAAEVERVETAASEAACGLGEYAAGKRLLVFAQGAHPGRLSADLCGGSAVFDQATADQVLAITRISTQPAPGASSDPLLPHGPREDAWDWSRPLSIAGGIVVLSVLALVVVRLLRRRRPS